MEGYGQQAEEALKRFCWAGPGDGIQKTLIMCTGPNGLASGKPGGHSAKTADTLTLPPKLLESVAGTW